MADTWQTEPVRRTFLTAWLLGLLVASSLIPAIGSAAESPPDDVAVSPRTAQRLGLRVGDVIEVGADPSMTRARRVRIAAIWTGPEHPADVARGDPQLRMHLPALEDLLGRHDVADRVIVRLQHGVDLDAAARVRDDLRGLALGFDAYTAGELVERTSQTFVVIARFHRAIGLITVFAGGIFLVTLMALRLTEMRREIGALRLMGVSRRTIGATIMLVAAVITGAGCVAGVLLGAVMVWAINSYYQPLFGTTLRFATLEPRTVAFTVALGVALGLGAGAAAAARILRRTPLDQVSR
jgi:putative ABC transport system permease protein